MSRRGRRMVVWIAGLLAFAVLGVALHAGRHRLQAHIRYWTATSTFLPRSQEYRGEPVDVAAGEIAVRDFLQFLADYHGRPVVLESNTPLALRMQVPIAAPIKGVTAELVRAILLGHRFQLESMPFIDGGEVMFVVDLDSERLGYSFGG